MAMSVTKLKTSFVDDRGEIKDILVREPVDAITVIRSKKGVVRGNHYHKKTVQWTYLHEGRVKYLSQAGDGPVEACIVEPGDLIVSPAMEKHAVIALEESVFYVFTRGPRGGESYEDDTYRLDTPLVDPETV